MTPLQIGGRYLIRPAGRDALHDAWCNEISPGGYVRLKRCADRQSEWFRAEDVVIVEVLDPPPPCVECGKREPLAEVGKYGAVCVGCEAQR